MSAAVLFSAYPMSSTLLPPSGSPLCQPFRLVLDTNIVMDLLHFADPHTAALADGLDSGRLQCFTDAECLAELARVAGYPEFGLDLAAQNALLARYRRLAHRCDASEAADGAGDAHAHLPHRPLPQCRDPDDQKFLILAVRCCADLLLTRDKALLRLDASPSIRPAHARLPFRIVTAAAAGSMLSGGHTAPEDPASCI